jgi:hypothetical protein
MPSQYIISVGSNYDFSANVRAYRTVMKANAEEGSVAISTLIVDDESGTFNITGDVPFTWNETSESSNSSIIMHGYVADRDISRGPFRTQNSRQWSVNVADINSILNRRMVFTANADRPAETDVARMQWVLSGTGLGTYVTDQTYLSTASPVAMDANDYRNQRVFDIVDDCAQQSGKNYFLLINELIAGKPTGIFYDFAGSTAYASPVRLTNVLADVDSTTTFAVFNDDLKLNRDPSRVYSSIMVPYNGGQVLSTSDTTAINFFPRDVMAPAVNVRTAAKALARAQRYITDASTEEDRLTMSYLVPLARVNRLKEGHTFQVKFSHLPGYQDWTWVRAVSRQTEAISEEFYKVTLEATIGSTAAAAIACSAQASTISSSFWDEGEHHQTNSTPAVVFIPGITTSAQSIVITLWACVNNSEEVAHAGSVISQGGSYTVWGNSRLGYAFGFPSLAVAGYKSVTGAAPSTSISFTNNTGSAARSWRALAMAFRTSATSPLQTAFQNGSGGTATLGAAPTVGNILVLAKFAETQGFAPPDPPPGFTRVGSVGTFSDGIGTQSIELCYRCVETGDTAVVNVGDANSSHWGFLSEWALT